MITGIEKKNVVVHVNQKANREGFFISVIAKGDDGRAYSLKPIKGEWEPICHENVVDGGLWMPTYSEVEETSDND